MTTTINYRGVNFVLCKAKTVEELRYQMAAEEEEATLREALEKARVNEDWDFYSDLYKDLYGVRPRW